MLAALLAAVSAGPVAAKDFGGKWWRAPGDEQACIQRWQDAPAYEYCSGASVSHSRIGDKLSICDVSGSCSITVNVGQDSVTSTPNLDLTMKLQNTDRIDICFSASATSSGYAASVRGSCRADETGSGDATTYGLSAPDPPGDPPAPDTTGDLPTAGIIR